MKLANLYLLFYSVKIKRAPMNNPSMGKKGNSNKGERRVNHHAKSVRLNYKYKMADWRVNEYLIYKPNVWLYRNMKFQNKQVLDKVLNTKHARQVTKSSPRQSPTWLDLFLSQVWLVFCNLFLCQSRFWLDIFHFCDFRRISFLHSPQ